MTKPFIHALADVQTTAIGASTRIWQFVVVLPGAKIGDDCNICSHSLIGNDDVIGASVTVKSGVQLGSGRAAWVDPLRPRHDRNWRGRYMRRGAACSIHTGIHSKHNSN